MTSEATDINTNVPSDSMLPPMTPNYVHHIPTSKTRPGEISLLGQPPYQDARPVTSYSEYTTFIQLFRCLVQHFLRTIDSTILSWLNWVLLFTFSWILVLGLIIHIPLRAANIFMRQKVYPIIIGGKRLVLSNVNVIEPSMLKKYSPVYCKEDADKRPKAECVLLDRKEFDLTNAIFFSHLCALAYEPFDNAELIAKHWGLETYAVFRPSAGCYLFYSTEHNFINVVFKGTSPFDLSEWLTDVMASQVRAGGCALPGNLHQGFVDLFEFQTRTLDERMNSERNKEGYYNVLIQAIDNIIETTKGLNNPKIWVTGHSLGAALATIFYSALLYDLEFPLKGTERSELNGCYVIGSPRSGDTDFVLGMNGLKLQHHYRITNGNDLISYLPPRIPYTDRVQYDSFFDYQHIGVPVKLSYAGLLGYKVESGPLDVVINYIFYWASVIALPYTTFMLDEPMQVQDTPFRVRPTTGWGAFLRVVLPSTIVDHLPNEYVAHLEWARELTKRREKRVPALKAEAPLKTTESQ